MKKRVISLVLAIALLLSVATVGVMSVSAADQNAAESSVDKVIYFTIPDFWVENYSFVPGGDSTKVYCHVFQIGTADPDFKDYTWQTRNERCTYDAATGRYQYPIGEKFPNLKDNADYGVIFSAMNTEGNAAQAQTYDLTMGTDCYGDEVYVENKIYQNIVDSSKQAYVSYWKGSANAEKYGPHAGITSLGVLQGEKYAPHEDKVLAVANFIKDYNANIPTNEDPQVCVTLCNSLNVEPYDVYVKYSTTYAEEIESGSIPDLVTVAGYLGLSYPPHPPVTGGDVNNDGSVDVKDATIIQLVL
ncbi:MAG: hypothetical protein J1E56_07640, partial [Ruminococcus sp.]|nr:hypothetical protein [Ruminococcus sp.]